MQEEFEKIKEAYGILHKEFLSSNPVLVKHFEEGIWVPSHPKDLHKLFSTYSDTSLLDLGSGDGVVLMVASLFFKKVVGIEKNKEFFDLSKTMQEKLKPKNVSLIHDDFLNHVFSSFDVVFISPDQPFSLALERKLREELKGKLIVYSPMFYPQTLSLIEEKYVGNMPIKIYENTPK